MAGRVWPERRNIAHFLVSVHTQNRCDGTLGNVCKCISHYDEGKPRRMHQIVEISALSMI